MIKQIAKIICPLLNIALFLCEFNQNGTMKKTLEAVAAFHKAFGLGISDIPVAHIGEKKLQLRFNLMAEENEEYRVAATENNIVEVADALGDMLYILCGTILEHGLHHKIEEVFEEIQRSNMSKLYKDGKPLYREDGKVMKGPDYIRPDIAKIVCND
jgi:predicted HAD superfamily Cof-like phosphohydrolase